MITTGVLRELDGLKRNINNETAFNARRAAVYISRNMDNIYWIDTDYMDIPVDDQLLHLSNEKQAILLTNDVYLKVKAEINNVRTKGYSHSDDYDGVYYWYVDSISNSETQNILNNILTNEIKPDCIELNENQYLIIKDTNLTENDTIGTFVYRDGKLKKIGRVWIKNSWVNMIFPKNPEQECLFEALNKKENTIIYAGGTWGGGKSFLLNNYALQELESEKIRKIIYIPNNSYVDGAMELGFLPGSDLDKTLPGIGPLIDLVGQDFVNQMIMREQLEVVPMAYIRGRSFDDSIIIVNEAQNLTEEHVKLLIARCGKNTRIFFDGDIKQADSQLFRNKNGLKLLLSLRKSPVYSKMFSTVKLNTTERSITAQAAQFLDEQ